MNIQKRIDKRECMFWKKQTCDIKLKENLMAKKYQFTERDMCINCHSNYEDVQIQEMIHETLKNIKKLRKEKQYYIPSGVKDEDLNIVEISIFSKCEKELKPLCGCKRCLP